MPPPPTNAALYERKTYLVARLAANVRRLRHERQWTQAQAAEACEMAVYMLQTVESGRANFTGTVLARLCDGLGAPVEELLKPAAPLAPRKRGRPRKAAPEGEEGRSEA